MLPRRPALLFLAVIVALSACTARAPKGQVTGPDAAPGAVPDITGHYVVNGFDPLGSEFSGVLDIAPGSAAGAYSLHWLVTGSVQQGTGQLEGNRLLVAWQTVAEQRLQSSGLVTYTVTTRRELYGIRSIAGYPGEGREAALPDP